MVVVTRKTKGMAWYTFGLVSYLCNLLVCALKSYLTFLNLIFLIFKIRI